MRPFTRFRTLLVAAAFVPLAAAPIQAQVAWETVPVGFPRTAAEANGFTAHTRHLEMWDYLRRLRSATTEMRLTSYGQTREGRELPLAIFSRPLITEPWEAWALGRPIVVLAANVHGGERTFREGLLVLMRELATPGTRANALLDEVTILVAPQINPDGFEASLEGQRGNSWGIDLNRDYVKLEHPSIANLVGNVISEWRPHLVIDGHNGGSRPYNLVYQCPSHYDTMRELTLICDDEIFPAIEAALATEGYRSWYYQQGDEEEWRVGGFQARIGRNYVGFTNSIGILFEAPAQELEDGARAGYIGYRTVVEFVAENAAQVSGLVERARTETIAMGAEPRGDIAVTMEYGPEDYPADYLLVRDGRGGARADTIQVTGARFMKKPVATRFRPRPWAYLLPRDATDAVAMLLRHGITVERLEAPTRLSVDAYSMAGVTYEQAYNHAAALRVQVGDIVRLDQEFPPGTYVVPTAQYLGRLVTHMLEPETDDNVVYWNTMDAWIPRDGGVVPIYKLMTPTALNARVVIEVERTPR
ncbi:MAG: M14 family zinc carboxypeptidase [Gemmatimonadota bacterium]|nr:M14 family zinc carboxypeptidase [Gemmatimonadota bacterium]